ncbi:MAG: methionine--tRNA ligase subunit beta, partial [Firmicutes bacterium]|nr:methionine--tRNA ligase subunit beta [Bacillota bacterium]
VFDMTEGISVEKGEALFPRLDVQAELEALEKIKEAASGAPARSYEPYKDAIEYPDFEKLDLRTGTIISAEKHPKADKLLVFKVQMGCEVRQIVSGVAESYKPEECVGKNVIVVANLKPRTLRGVESNGMLLFADQDGKYIFASTEAEPGMVVC